MKKIFGISALILSLAACGKSMSIQVDTAASNQTVGDKTEDTAKKAACIDLTGTYTTTDDDGEEVEGTFTQTGCEKIEFKFDEEEFLQTYLLDGQLHGSVSAKVEKDTILAEVKAVYQEGEVEAVEYIGTKMIYSIDAKTGDILLNVKTFDKDGTMIKEENKVLKKKVTK